MRYLKKIFKNPVYLLSSVFLIIIIIIFVVFFSEFRIISGKINYYGQEISRLSDSADKINDAANQRFAKLRSAELILNNTNKILTTVYFGTADEGAHKEAKNFTAFSMLYDGKFYIITAGHCIELDGTKYDNFKFKANNSKTWITPDLLDYKNDYKNNLDYAIFYNGSPVNTGLIPAAPGEDMTPQYVLGSLERSINLVKRYSDAKEGESGSPILNENCHVMGLMIKDDSAYTPIEVVLDALSKLQDK